MKYYSQYGEEIILQNIFGDKKDGLCVEIGAADGQLYSNSRFLIESMDWRAILVEPHPDFFNRLCSLYENNDKVKLIQSAVSKIDGFVDMFLYGRDKYAQVSTISESQKQKVIKAHGDKFLQTPEKVKSLTLSSVLNDNKVDFLSIDCEGVDMEVLYSNDWYKNRPYLICVEHSMEEKVLLSFMESINYTKLCKTAGNTFFLDGEQRELLP